MPPFGMVFCCDGPALRQPHMPTTFLFRRKLTYSPPTNCHMPFTYVTHLILIPATQGHRVLKSCDRVVQAIRVLTFKKYSPTTQSQLKLTQVFTCISQIFWEVYVGHSNTLLKFPHFLSITFLTSHISKFTYTKIFFKLKTSAQRDC